MVGIKKAGWKRALASLDIGGYGNFGARIARALVRDAAIELLIGGRDGHRAAAFAAELGGGAQGRTIDMHSPNLAEHLRLARVELLIHTAGPFQSQQDYHVARAAAGAGVHYIDLADGRRFVCDFGAHMDAAFSSAGRVGISGASTVPALSLAVVDALSVTWQALETIEICIAPAQTAPRGLATMAAVLSYCGAPIKVWRHGAWDEQPGWAAPQRVVFRRLRPRLAALCDIPDLELFPARYVGVQTVTFRAALELGFTQRGMASLAWLRRAGLLPRPERLALLMLKTAGWLDPLGSALGGKVVALTGRDAEGRPVARSWHIAADHDHGPEIPCMAAILLAQRLARGESFAAGAWPCMGLLRLDEFAPEFERWDMVSDLVDDGVQP